jgi:hypothetical protein
MVEALNTGAILNNRDIMSTPKQKDFIDLYLDYTEATETPRFFNRWSCLSMVGAYLGRQVVFKLGTFDIHPNLYMMLIGSPGTRKSTAIKTAKSILSQVGYDTFSAEKTSKEKFLLDLQGDPEDSGVPVDILDQNLFGSAAPKDSSEMYIAADEFNDYIGNGNIEFISMLGSMWDYAGTYRNRIKNGKSVNIPNPTVSILGGTTPTSFATAFPPEIIGQGFFSRLLLIYGESTGKKIAFPKRPSDEVTSNLLDSLRLIKSTVHGEAYCNSEAETMLEYIYNSWCGVDDVRFESYSNRRFTHLLKLCLLCAAVRWSIEITQADVIYANTILSHTEHLMPKALGEFGKAKHSDVAHKIVTILDAASGVMLLPELWKHVHNDLEKFDQLAEIVANLKRAEKIQFANGGFLAKKKVVVEVGNGTVDFSLLTREERSYHL